MKADPAQWSTQFIALAAYALNEEENCAGIRRRS
jgi:hypothetical protein